MPDQKISELSAITTIDNSADVLPIVDTSATTTKKVTPTQLKASLALDNVDNTSDANKPISTATQTALDGKVDENAAITGATKTKITYDAKGLVTAGADATTADIADSTNKRYVTDAQLTVIGNTSGTNTGDNAVNSLYSGLATSKQDTLVSGTNIKTVNSTSLLGSGDVAVQATLVSGTNIKTINSTSLLGSGDITISASPSGVSGAIQFSNGSAFASDASNFFWDDTNNRLGVGTNAPSATAHIVGANSLSSGYAVKVLNSSGGGILSVTNDGYTQIGDFTGQGFGTLLTFLRPAGGTRLTTFNQGNSNLVITNGIGNVTFQNTPVQVVGSGSTSATTSLLVQNSGGTELLKVADNGEITTFDINARVIYARANTLELRPNASGGASSASLQGFVSGLGWLNMFTTENGKDFGQIPRGAVVNGTTIDASAIFQIDSTTKGFLPPRMTTTQKNAITAVAGLVVYDSTTNKLCCYNGSTWNDLF